MTREEFKIMVKTHKKEIILGTGTAVLGGLLFVITRKSPSVKRQEAVMNWTLTKNSAAELARIEALNCNVGVVTDFWQEGDFANIIASDLKVADIGDFGKELLKIKGVTNETPLSLVMSLFEIKLES